MAEFVYLTPDEYRALRERIDRAESSTTHWKSETLRLRARLAVVEAALARALAAEAKLAAVRHLPAKHGVPEDDWYQGWMCGYNAALTEIHALLGQEDER